ncbi:TetR/AcrR family transcriptional regulator [Demequina sp. TTPB684]|uniref:TetR/AcrR family transcriptional regulator n=1 Tax=unclassified Demequina TaxID=2620311 RepID=UPI001CF48E23|nr:TetR/AcrR family transcriptional regulator [Demequina sp. TMPB413]MCB2411659.1 TetR/AcrR family transcriptional regulator [Demequina sp. TTPB684]UPU88041.1 TetR/AcrR family transcriptional regulator [Demequina sp. TMPB413]
MTPFVDGDARASILEAATATFAKEGIDGVSMRQIAKDVGVSATALYRHFDSKNALVHAACEAGFAEFGARIEATMRGAETPLDGLRQLGGVYVDFALSRPVHYDVMMIRPHQWALGPDAARDPESFASLVRVVQACQDAGQLSPGDPREAAHRLWAVLHGVVSLAIAMPDSISGLDPQSVRARADGLMEAVIATLA